MDKLKIAGIQTQLHWEDIEQNLSMFSDKIKQLNSEVDLLILPEMFTTGFSMNAIELAEEMDGKTIQWMKGEAKSLDAVITGSIIIKDDGEYYNRLIWMPPNGDFEYYDKRHLFRLSGEHNHYSAGAEKKIVEYKSWRINLNICYDLRFPVWSRNEDDYDILLNVANWPEKRAMHWAALLKARAIENLAYVVGVNRYGNDGNDFYYSGHSAMVNPMGVVVIEAIDQDKIIYCECSKEELEAHRKRFGFLKDRDIFSVRI